MPFEAVGAWNVLDKRNKKKKNPLTFPLQEKEAIPILFNVIKANDADTLQVALASLDQLQRSKYFAACQPFESSWARGLEEMTFLQYASFLGHLECVRVLIACRASVFDFRATSTATYRSSLHFAVDGGHTAVALFLLEHGAKDHLAVCEALHGFSKYQLPSEPRSSHTHLTALHMAILLNMYDVAEALLVENKEVIFIHASGNTTALHLAVRAGHEKMMQLLEASGASSLWDDEDYQGNTPRKLRK